MDPIDPVDLTRALVRRPSVTPDAAAALEVVAAALRAAGFTCELLRFEQPETAPVDNLFAKLGDGHPHLVLAGHVDVVPPGDPARWSVDPFAGEIRDGMLWGRGAADMKSGVAALVAAAARHVARHGLKHGAISFLITGDEEGVAVNGTARLVAWARERGERFDHCVLAEPTSLERLGDTAKIGRRGSLSGSLTVRGRQGHTAYPQRADNAAHRIVAMLQALLAEPIDAGTTHFEPSDLQLTSIDIGNPATNVIPGEARARFNIRYNDSQNAASLEHWLRARLDAVGGSYRLELASSGDAFITEPGRLSDLLSASVEGVTGRRPALATSGGTSDARFIKDHCPVIEFGLVGATIHQVDERVAVADIERLTLIFEALLGRYFGV
jgi:succinyl-diaminopimelate desuccinylase